MGRTVSVGQVALEAANDSQGHGIGSVADSSLPVPDSSLFGPDGFLCRPEG